MGNGRLLTSSTMGRGGRTEVLLLSLPDDGPATEVFLGILILNLYLLIPLMTSVINGLDSSLINGMYGHRVMLLSLGLWPCQSPGLQISPDWQEYFHHPKGKTLGEFFVIYPNLNTLNDVQVSSILPSFLATFSLFSSLLSSLISLADDVHCFLAVVSCALGLPSRLLHGV